MDVAKLFFNARQRNAWQVFDLTQLMVKHYFVNLMLIVLSVYLPIIIIFSLIFDMYIASILVWWLKPLLERPLLDFLSKRSFYQPTSTWSSILSLKKLSVIDIISMLTIRRLSPYRAYVASVEQLEMLQGVKRKKRKNVLLNRNDHKQTFWLIFCVHIELILTFLFMVVAYNFIPQGVSINEQFYTNGTFLYELELLYSCCYFIAIMLIAPYYVTGGFLGYLNTRIDMEGWDLELTFKRIAKRFSHITTVLVIGVLSFTLPTPPLSAQEVSTQEALTQETPVQKTSIEPVVNQDNAEHIEEEKEVLNERNISIRAEVDKLYDEHQLIEKTNIWKPLVESDDSDVDLQWLKDFFKSIASLGNIVAYLFWLLLAALVAWIAYKLYQSGGFKWLNLSATNIKPVEKSIELPTFLSNLDHKEEPQNLLEAAQNANNKQAYRVALMYLLKHAFVYAQRFSDVLITQSMSEKECEQALLKALPVLLHKHYQQLFHLWIQQAWAHRDVSQQHVNEVISAFYAMKPEQFNNE